LARGERCSTASKKTKPGAHKDASLQQWACLPLLRAGGLKVLLSAQADRFAYSPIYVTELQEDRAVLSVTVQKLGGVAILRCQGRIVRGQETAILCAAVQQNGRDLILDLRKVDVIDAGGLGALISLRSAGICLKLMDPTAHVREILRLTKLDSIFEICGSESIAVISENAEWRHKNRAIITTDF
jgi:anti-anti-sigma factor